MNIEFVEVLSERQIESVAAIADMVWHEHYSAILSLSQIDYMVRKYQSAAAVKEQVEKQNYKYYMVVCNGVDAGYAGVKAENGKLFLSKIYLLVEFRGRGLSSRVFDFLDGICRREGLSAVWLTVNRNNAGSIAVYRHKGFRIVDSAVSDIGGGYVMDDYIMERTL